MDSNQVYPAPPGMTAFVAYHPDPQSNYPEDAQALHLEPLGPVLAFRIDDAGYPEYLTPLMPFEQCGRQSERIVIKHGDHYFAGWELAAGMKEHELFDSFMEVAVNLGLLPDKARKIPE